MRRERILAYAFMHPTNLGAAHETIAQIIPLPKYALPRFNFLLLEACHYYNTFVLLKVSAVSF